MRRSDREVTSFDDQLDIIRRCDVCRLALIDEETPYIVPLNFGWQVLDGRLSLFFHCAQEGHKLDLIRKCPAVAFEMDCDHELITAPSPCGYGFRYVSVMGAGRVSLLDSPTEKAEGLAAVMRHMAGIDPVFTPEMTGSICVLRLDVRHITAKRHA